MNKKKIILASIFLSTLITFNCNNSDDPEQQPEPETFLCCGENPFENMNVDNLDQSMGEIKAGGVLTPDGDGLNDSFFIQNIALYPANSVTIYDMDNTVVFQTDAYESNPFDGQNEMNGSELPFGTYKYKIVVENESTFVEYGYVCLLRDYSEAGDFSFANCFVEDPNDPYLQ